MEAMNAKEKTILAQGQAAIESSLAILQHNNQPEPYHNILSHLPLLGNIGAIVMFYCADILPHELSLLVGIYLALLTIRGLLSFTLPSAFIIKSLTFLIGWLAFGYSFSSFLLVCSPMLISFAISPPLHLPHPLNPGTLQNHQATRRLQNACHDIQGEQRSSQKRAIINSTS